MEDILGKQKITPNQKWKKGVVWSEIKYGESLDGVTQNGNKRSYDSLLSLLKKKEETTPDELASKEESEAIGIIANLVPSLAISTSLYAGNDFAKKAQNYIHELKQITNADLRLKIATAKVFQSFQVEKGDFLETQEGMQQIINEMTKPQPMYKLGGDTGNEVPIPRIVANKLLGLATKAKKIFDTDVDGFLLLSPLVKSLIGSDDFRQSSAKAIAWHETGHNIEILTGSVDESSDFISSKKIKFSLSDPSMESLKVTSKGNVIQDNLMDSYSALIYKDKTGKPRATEIVSTGVEYLSDPNALKLAARYDREHILYTMYVLNKERTK
jgi:hypothetical protein